MSASNKYCPMCLMKGKNSSMKVYQMNMEEAVVMCENIECPFPFVKGVNSTIFQRPFIEENKLGKQQPGKQQIESEMKDKGSRDREVVSSQSSEFGDTEDLLNLDSKPVPDTNLELMKIYEELNCLADTIKDEPCNPIVNCRSSSSECLKTWDNTSDDFSQLDSSPSCSKSLADDVIHKTLSELEKLADHLVNSLNSASHDVSSVMTKEENQFEASIGEHENTDPFNSLGSDIVKNPDNTTN